MKDTARLTTSLLAFILMGSALLVRPPAASAVPGKLTDDAYTIGGSSTNTGIQGVLHVIDAGASTQKTFIQFDLSSMSALPSPLTSADVDKASLTLFVDAVGAAGSIDLREVTSAWNESTVNGMPEPTTVASTVPSFMVTTSRKFVVIDVTDLVKAWRMRTVLQEKMADFQSRYDVIVTPNFMSVAPSIHGDLNQSLPYADPVGAVGNSCGLPSIALPSGFGKAGMPVGFQIMGAPFEESTLLGLGELYQSRTRFHRERPPIQA